MGTFVETVQMKMIIPLVLYNINIWTYHPGLINIFRTKTKEGKKQCSLRHIPIYV